MQHRQNKIVGLLLSALRFHVGAHVGLLPVDYRVEQLKLVNMFNIINVKAPEYLTTNVLIHNKSQQLGMCYSKSEGFWTNSLLLYKHMPLEQPAYRNKTMSI